MDEIVFKVCAEDFMSYLHSLVFASMYSFYDKIRNFTVFPHKINYLTECVGFVLVILIIGLWLFVKIKDSKMLSKLSFFFMNCATIAGLLVSYVR